jgi:release factor glutamine methyltransferase
VGDLFAPVANARFELVVSNPPYVPSAEIATLEPNVRDFEPRAALDGGADGLDLVRAVVRHAPAYLEPRGVLALEIGFDQADRVASLFEQAGFAEIERRRDYGGRERVVSGRF